MNRTRRCLHGLTAVAALLAPPLTGGAHAHHGYAGPVRLYVETVTVEHRAEGWLVRAAVKDSGSGKPAPGFLVHATGSGPQGAAFGPVTLADADADGRYEAGLGALPAGDWSVTVDVGDAPGGEERAIPITRAWSITLQPDEVLHDMSRPVTPAGDPPSSSGSGGGVPAAAAAAGLGALGAVTFTRLRRRGTPAADPAS